MICSLAESSLGSFTVAFAVGRQIIFCAKHGSQFRILLYYPTPNLVTEKDLERAGKSDMG